MQQRKSRSNFNNFVLRNWYKLGAIAFLLYIFFQKDLSFEINLNNPVQMEQESPNQGNPTQFPIKKEREKYTESKKPPSITDINSGSLDRFDITLFGSSDEINSMKELRKIGEDTKMKYFKRFANVVVSEQKKFGIPASIILANSFLHSHSGKRDIANSGNNYFAISCDSWNGPSGKYDGKCFKHYKNAWSSFRDHSQYVTTGKFQPLRQFSSTDYQSWAKGLEQLGFSKEPNLSNSLIQIIEQYRLYDLDRK